MDIVGIESSLDNKDKEIKSIVNKKEYTDSNSENLDNNKQTSYIVIFIVALMVFALGIFLVNTYFIEK